MNEKDHLTQTASPVPAESRREEEALAQDEAAKESSSETSEGRFRYRAMLDALQREKEAYDNARNYWEENYSGKYVAILDGKLIDSDEDAVALTDRVTPKMRDIQRTALLVHVGAEEKEELVLPFTLQFPGL